MKYEWPDIFKNEYLPELENLESNFQANDKENYMDSLQKLYQTSINLLAHYMAFCGIYPNDYRQIITSAYYHEIIDNGQLWINILMDSTNPKMNFFKEKYINIFKDLKNYLDKETEYWDV